MYKNCSCCIQYLIYLVTWHFHHRLSYSSAAILATLTAECNPPPHSAQTLRMLPSHRWIVRSGAKTVPCNFPGERINDRIPLRWLNASVRVAHQTGVSVRVAGPRSSPTRAQICAGRRLPGSLVQSMPLHRPHTPAKNIITRRARFDVLFEVTTRQRSGEDPECLVASVSKQKMSNRRKAC